MNTRNIRKDYLQELVNECKSLNADLKKVYMERKPWLTKNDSHEDLTH